MKDPYHFGYPSGLAPAPPPVLPQDGGACGALSRAIDVACLIFVFEIMRARMSQKGTHD